MPGAMAKGLLARKAMQNMPTADAKQVAMNTAFQSSCPLAPKPVSRLGFSAMM